MIVVVVGRGTQPHNLIPRVFDVGVLTSRFLQNNNKDMKMNTEYAAAGSLKKLVLLVHE